MKKNITEKEKMMYIKIVLSTIILLGILGCSKEDTAGSIIGKWYYASIDTKIQKGSGCDLKDTSYYYTKTNTAIIYEFKSDKTFSATAAGSSFSSQGTYTFSNNTVTINATGSSSVVFSVMDLNSEGWRVKQKNYVWCPAKTSFDEFLNYKKY